MIQEERRREYHFVAGVNQCCQGELECLISTSGDDDFGVGIHRRAERRERSGQRAAQLGKAGVGRVDVGRAVPDGGAQSVHGDAGRIETRQALAERDDVNAFLTPPVGDVVEKVELGKLDVSDALRNVHGRTGIGDWELGVHCA